MLQPVLIDALISTCARSWCDWTNGQEQITSCYIRIPDGGGEWGRKHILIHFLRPFSAGKNVINCYNSQHMK